MLRNLATSLLRHETIRTTLPKAKELRRIVEPLITLGKDDSDTNRRRAFAQLRDADVVVKLFERLGPRFLSRPGGYTRIVRMDPRPGDAAPMALMQLLDQPEATLETPDVEDDTATATAGRKQTAAKKTSPKKKTVKTDEQRAVKKEKQAAKVANKVKKAENKATAKSSRKPAAPKKKAAVKKKASR